MPEFEPEEPDIQGRVDKPVKAPKKWWWVPVVAVPIVVGIIAIVPQLLPKGDVGTRRDNTIPVHIEAGVIRDVIFNDVNVVIEAAQELSDEQLPGSVVDALRQAETHIQSENFEKAIPLLESAAAAAPIPAVFNNLGVAYLGAGDRESAKQYFEQALAGSPDDQVAQYNLSLLATPALVEGARVVHYSSDGRGSPSWIFDGTPNWGWYSKDGNFPQDIVVELPGEFLISKFSFDHTITGNTDLDAKDIQIHVSREASDNGFEEVVTFTLKKGQIAQGFLLDFPVRARWIKLRIQSNHGDIDNTRLMEVRIIGVPVAPAP